VHIQTSKISNWVRSDKALLSGFLGRTSNHSRHELYASADAEAGFVDFLQGDFSKMQREPTLSPSYFPARN
jgi:hypothetical protein